MSCWCQGSPDCRAAAAERAQGALSAPAAAGLAATAAARSNHRLPASPCCCSYVSFAEILMRKCVASFGSVSIDDNAAYRWATLTFFGGMLIIAILDRVGVGCCWVLRVVRL